MHGPSHKASTCRGPHLLCPTPHDGHRPQTCQEPACLRTLTPPVPSACSLFLDMHVPHSLTFTSLLRRDFSVTLITVFTLADHSPPRAVG